MQDKDRNARPERDAYEQVGEYVRIFRRGNTWYANFQHEGKQHRQSLKTKSKKEARLRALRLENAVRDGGIKRPPEAPTIVQAIDEYLALLNIEGRAQTTLARYRTVYQNLLLFAAQSQATKISQVDLPFLDAFRRQRLAAGRRPSTVHKEAKIIKQLLQFAETRGRLARNPLRDLKLKMPPQDPQPWWTWEQVQSILDAAEEPQRTALILLAETGMRIGELRHLTWEDVDFQNGVILICQKEFSNPKTGRKEVWKPKTGKPRALPMSPAARQVLEKLPRTGDWVFAAPSRANTATVQFRLAPDALRRYLQRILAQLGLKGHLHTFRHSFISNALTRGIPEAIVRQWVGHIDPEILKLYTHIADQASQQAMQRLAGYNHVAETGKES